MSNKNRPANSLPGLQTAKPPMDSGLNGKLNGFLIDYTLSTIKSWQLDLFYRCLLQHFIHEPPDDMERFLDFVHEKICESQKQLKQTMLRVTPKYKAVLRVQRAELENGFATLEQKMELAEASKKAEKALDSVKPDY